MLSIQQQQKITQLSDTILYHEAPTFLRELIRTKDMQPLPNTQINGLLNIAKGYSYTELERFIKHQRDRNWNYSKLYLKTFYTELELLFSSMRTKRLRGEFQLLAPELTAQQMQQQANELMASLAYEFIQHLEAENRLLDAQQRDQRFAGRQQNRPPRQEQRR